ncbi:Nitroreductase [Bryocella elongata]|uniref:Nitroreductase n=1 Tax=Bryocella elongata TaxID=863522 RepID=A0A1H5SD63_9BACT|nr:nitroreductase family protein [Bryocella elongata]SEF48613.1 Nitroreductase [Bryocella elongata]
MGTTLKSLAQAIRDRRATPSFDGEPIPAGDLRQILDAGLSMPSGYNIQPWRFVVVQHPEQRKRLRAASYNQAKVEEASAVIVACGDRDGWRKDLDEVLRMGRAGGMSESYAAQAEEFVPSYLSSFNADQMAAWLNKHVMIAFTAMMLMAEVMGYDTAPMEGFEQQKVCETLRLPMSYHVVALLAIGKNQGPDKFNGGRFDMAHTVFGEEYGKPLK